MYGLAGLRVGYGIANEEMIGFLNRVREPFNINSLAQEAAIACLKDSKYYEKIKAMIVEEKQILYQEFRKLGLPFVESSTNFVLVNAGAADRKISDGLLRKGVIVRDMDFWGMKNFIRVTVGTPKENQKFIRALKHLIG